MKNFNTKKLPDFFEVVSLYLDGIPSNQIASSNIKEIVRKKRISIYYMY
jgi:hypothetical protein